MLETSNVKFITLNNNDLGEGGWGMNLHISQTDAAKVGKRAKTFIGDCPNIE